MAALVGIAALGVLAGWLSWQAVGDDADDDAGDLPAWAVVVVALVTLIAVGTASLYVLTRVGLVAQVFDFQKSFLGMWLDSVRAFGDALISPVVRLLGVSS